MQKTELIDLAAKWWRNKIEWYIPEMERYFTKHSIDISDARKHIYLLMYTKQHLDSFESNLREILEAESRDGIALFVNREASVHSVINNALLTTGILPCLFNLVEVYTMIINNEFMLLSFPTISHFSTYKIKSENDYIDMNPYDM